jgi:hypothetical protein
MMDLGPLSLLWLRFTEHHHHSLIQFNGWAKKLTRELSGLFCNARDLYSGWVRSD